MSPGQPEDSISEKMRHNFANKSSWNVNEERKERSSGGRQAKQRLRCGSDLCSSVGRSRRWGRGWEGRRVSVEEMN